MPTLPSLAELGGCIFGKQITKNGYSQIFHKGKQQAHHRVIFENLFGPIPKGMHIDHICHNVAVANGMCLGERNCIHRSCINPNHLRMLTPRENQLEGLRGLKNRVKCTNGHDLTIDGAIEVRNRPNGKTGQVCRECRLVNSRNAQSRFRARKKEALIG